LLFFEDAERLIRTLPNKETRERWKKMEENIVTVEDLHKTYGKDVQAVDGISFTVKKGEIFGFLGRARTQKLMPLIFSIDSLRGITGKKQKSK
jgi:ABC-type uncharacterized transport system ATPase subunit